MPYSLTNCEINFEAFQPIPYLFSTFNGMALNSLHCAEVPLRNCSLTFNLHACPQWQTDRRTNGWSGIDRRTTSDRYAARQSRYREL